MLSKGFVRNLGEPVPSSDKGILITEETRVEDEVQVVGENKHQSIVIGRNRSRNSRQGCESWEVQVLLPSVARIGRLAYPGHGEVTNREVFGCKSHGCSAKEKK